MLPEVDETVFAVIMGPLSPKQRRRVLKFMREVAVQYSTAATVQPVKRDRKIQSIRPEPSLYTAERKAYFREVSAQLFKYLGEKP